MSFETAVELVEFLRKRGGKVHSGGFVLFKVCDIVNALPHASCIVGVNFIFVLLFGGFNGFPEVIVGLFLFFHVSGFKRQRFARTRLLEHRY